MLSSLSGTSNKFATENSYELASNIFCNEACLTLHMLNFIRTSSCFEEYFKLMANFVFIYADLFFRTHTYKYVYKRRAVLFTLFFDNSPYSVRFYFQL